MAGQTLLRFRSRIIRRKDSINVDFIGRKRCIKTIAKWIVMDFNKSTVFSVKCHCCCSCISDCCCDIGCCKYVPPSYSCTSWCCRVPCNCNECGLASFHWPSSFRLPIASLFLLEAHRRRKGNSNCRAPAGYSSRFDQEFLMMFRLCRNHPRLP